ncbi:polyprenyl synthetase family protein [Ornithobacterium rhinotracheale]|uniref:Geranylgeranyl pyrophosphate synthase n=1 Tax=Ornithobacterium rhinotracheale (strain ATCC 51463 / DSM 15997 / CCUG 23171 / CIP 104009 / LMG 9086) TaxID=867902 RepID=I3ZXE8_ORNRL|nr:polyprenyl synthetase family protein [Ornithobacterium rhinotracheale]AFL96382.1 geranylgeranyl pyrophosphate synthase [Ornithobacterium rhinotracheale DSM 15997]AIP98609.1 polyprenyl synthetase [Ornithobacterium rhinotracheale ORT-UMN 88]KGB67613.1 polyprenyl synthetase [Ornithobacterium rhinotracheale H06-030791]MBN3662121.1 polyprenyl synthetase family protein [Ornithobacterium rhinotracheale]MCK0194711.1 polyprenyl synthetase family protein [Ornithobacterium rhinotracheale]
MTKIIDKIKNPISEEMNIFEDKFYRSMKTNVSLLDRIMQFIVRRKGKQMRPMFVFLTAKLIGKTTERTYRGASMIELIHTASLVHDDVVDDSNMRRGFFSINALWKNKIAVLVGDYLLSKSVLLATENTDFDLLMVVSNAIREMSEGELLQIEKAKKLDITEEVYFEIIRQKTAALISACCEIGARSVGADEEVAKKMYRFGELVGIAFQIKDDLFDYTNTNIIGKPIGIDIKEQKMTLPLIYSINTASPSEKRWLIRSVKKYNKDKNRVREVIEYVKNHGGLNYSEQVMYDYRDRALRILDDFEDSPAKDSLKTLLNYVVERKH